MMVRESNFLPNPSVVLYNLLFIVIIFLNDAEVLEEYTDALDPNTEYDVYIPSKKLAFEYQGEQHFTVTGATPRGHQVGKGVDMSKSASSLKLGTTLIEVPYWWDKKMASLIATIRAVRPELLISDAQDAESSQADPTSQLPSSSSSAATTNSASGMSIPLNVALHLLIPQRPSGSAHISLSQPSNSITIAITNCVSRCVGKKNGDGGQQEKSKRKRAQAKSALLPSVRHEKNSFVAFAPNATPKVDATTEHLPSSSLPRDESQTGTTPNNHDTRRDSHVQRAFIVEWNPHGVSVLVETQSGKVIPGDQHTSPMTQRKGRPFQEVLPLDAQIEPFAK
jgi:hypothetical protein